MEIHIIQVGQIGLTLLRKCVQEQQKGDKHFSLLSMVLIVFSIRLKYRGKQSFAGRINHSINLTCFKIRAHVQQRIDGGQQLRLGGWIHAFIESSDIA